MPSRCDDDLSGVLGLICFHLLLPNLPGMYVCVAEKCDMMDFFSTVVLIDNFPPSLGKKLKNYGFLCMYECVKQNP